MEELTDDGELDDRRDDGVPNTRSFRIARPKDSMGLSSAAARIAFAGVLLALLSASRAGASPLADDVLAAVNGVEEARGLPLSANGTFRKAALDAACNRALARLADTETLDSAYAAAVPLYNGGEIPSGCTFGCLLSDNPLAGLARGFQALRGGRWTGKCFMSEVDPETNVTTYSVENTVTSLITLGREVRVYPASVYVGPSLVANSTDDAIIIDYSESRAFRAFQDEVRTLAPGVHLGKLWRIGRGRDGDEPIEIAHFLLLDLLDPGSE